MRYWLYCEPVGESSEAVWHVWSDKAILASYYDHWCGLMRKVGRESQICEFNCITDWVATHWATPATADNLLRIISAPKPNKK